MTVSVPCRTVPWWWCLQPVLVAPPKSEQERARERLLAMYEGGLVIPVPFLRAAHAQPLALLNPIDAPTTTPLGKTGAWWPGPGLAGWPEPNAI